MAGFSRAATIGLLAAERAANQPIFDALCGSGLTAKMAARGGASLVTTHCLAHFRMQGLSSMAGYLPICDANALTLEIGEQAILNVVRECPVIAGLLCVDPSRDMPRFLRRIEEAGFDGIMNCPTIALIDGSFRTALEETGIGFAQEVEVIGTAHRMNFFTKAFCTTATEALAMAEAGADNLIIHFGNSSGGTVGAKTILSMQDALARCASILDAVTPRFPDLIFTCHGGSIETPAQFAQFWRAEPRLHGYVGGSSAERFPVESSVSDAARAFRAVRR
jgi:predicted TIM-barrel enzyme